MSQYLQYSMMTSFYVVETSITETFLIICDKCMAKNLKLSTNEWELLRKAVVFFGPMVKEGGISTSNDNICYVGITSTVSTPRCVHF